MSTDSVHELVEALRAGQMVVLADDENRENEGDLVAVAEHITDEQINFMATEARGLICLTLSAERCRRLELPLMVNRSGASRPTNFTVSIDAAYGVSTGISAADRARTVRAAVAADAVPTDLVQPGHIFPLRAEPGGVLTRAGHTEAGSDLAALAGAEPASVIVEIMNRDGSMARYPDLQRFAVHHKLRLGTIAELIHHRALHEQTVSPIATKAVSSRWGELILHVFRDLARGNLHFALVRGEIDSERAVLVRVQLPSLLGDLLDLTSDPSRSSGWNVPRALDRIAVEGGVLILLGGTGSEDDLPPDLQHILRDGGGAPALGASELSLRVGVGAQMLSQLGVCKMRLMARPAPYTISGFELEVVEYLSYDGNGSGQS